MNLRMLVSDEFSEKEGGTCKMPQTLGGTCVRITLHTDDADTIAERAVAHGARMLMPVQDMFWGARYGKLVDPFGLEWGINQQLKEQTDEETQAAAYFISVFSCRTNLISKTQSARSSPPPVPW